MDIELGGEPNGIEAGRTIKEKNRDVGIVILSAHKDKEYISNLSADEASGWSYLLKQSVGDASALGRAIEGSAAGLVVLDPDVVSGLKPRQSSAVSKLTPRQQEGLALMAQGYTNAAIAGELVLGKQISRKLHQRDISGAALESGGRNSPQCHRGAYVPEGELQPLEGVCPIRWGGLILSGYGQAPGPLFETPVYVLVGLQSQEVHHPCQG